MGEVREVTELIRPGPAQALAGLLRVPGPDEDVIHVACRDAAGRTTATGVIRPAG